MNEGLIRSRRSLADSYHYYTGDSNSAESNQVFHSLLQTLFAATLALIIVILFITFINQVLNTHDEEENNESVRQEIRPQFRPNTRRYHAEQIYDANPRSKRVNSSNIMDDQSDKAVLPFTMTMTTMTTIHDDSTHDFRSQGGTPTDNDTFFNESHTSNSTVHTSVLAKNFYHPYLHDASRQHPKYDSSSFQTQSHIIPDDDICDQIYTLMVDEKGEDTTRKYDTKRKAQKWNKDENHSSFDMISSLFPDSSPLCAYSDLDTLFPHANANPNHSSTDPVPRKKVSSNHVPTMSSSTNQNRSRHRSLSQSNYYPPLNSNDGSHVGIMNDYIMKKRSSSYPRRF